MVDPNVTDISVTPSRSNEQERGLLAYARVTIGGIVVDGITVRRTRDGRRVLSFPLRRDRSGRSHSIVRPMNDIVRTRITDQILAELDARGAVQADGGAR